MGKVGDKKIKPAVTPFRRITKYNTSLLYNSGRFTITSSQRKTSESAQAAESKRDRAEKKREQSENLRQQSENYRELMEAQRQVMEEMRQTTERLRLDVVNAHQETRLLLDEVRATMVEFQSLVNEMVQKLSAKS